MYIKFHICVLSIFIIGVLSNNAVQPSINNEKEDPSEKPEGLLTSDRPQIEDLSPVSNMPEQRISCDLFSGLGVKDSLCATHCILLGKGGGKCDNKGICVCR